MTTRLGLLAVLTFAASACGALRATHPPPLLDESESGLSAVRTSGAFGLAFSLRFVGATDGAPLLTIKLRNAGTSGVRIDAARLRVIGYGAHGPRTLQLVDPRGELEPLTLEPGVTAKEKVRLADPKRSEGELSRICVDPSLMVRVPLSIACFIPSSEAEWAVAQ